MATVFNTDLSTLGVNKDLAKERATVSFNVTELTHLFDGGPEKTKRRKELEEIVFSDPLFHNKGRLYLSKSDAYERAIQKSVKLFEWRRQYQWSDKDFEIVSKRINDFDEALTLHHAMFIPAIERLATDEQKAQWLPLAVNYKILGTYAQTELGHGTNLLKLETTATFDSRTDEFVMKTPRVSSMKWWPGALGKSTTHAIVLAQLVINGKHLGLQGFLVPLRSLDDHKPLPGVIVGDIGPKMSLNNADNGFLILNNVRIPRTNMLMRNAKVTPQGRFQAVKGDKSNYSTMMYVRVEISQWATGALCYGITTAMRYSAVRRQSSLKPNGDEVQILDYQAQQYKLFPALAASYCMFFTSNTLKDVYEKCFPEMMKGNRAVLAEMHSQSSVMKAVCAEISSHHMEIIRRGLGGHGFMMLAGISKISTGGLSLNTVEGENTVLYQQTARYLLKQVAKALSGDSLEGTSAYLGVQRNDVLTFSTQQDCLNLELLLEIYQRMSQRVLVRTARALQADFESGLEQGVAWNKNMVALTVAAKVHGIQYLIQCSRDSMTNLESLLSPELHRVLKRLCLFFAMHWIETNSGHFLETETISPAQLQLIRDTEIELLGLIRPDAVSLVDAFDIHDYTLDSALGSYDGNVYERMYQAALDEPMNSTDVHPSYYKYLRGLLKGSQSKL